MLAKALEPMTYTARKPPACKVWLCKLYQLISNMVGSREVEANIETGLRTALSPLQEMSSLTKI
jgi:hypothetical protein